MCFTLSEKKEQLVEVHKVIRQATIDLNQAESYFENSQYDGYEKNLKDVISGLAELIDKTRSRLD